MTTLSVRRARWAVFIIFMLTGLLIGAWVPHIPLAKDRLDVGTGVFGLALLVIAVGAVFSMPFTGALINRFGSAPVTLSAGLLFGLGFLGPVFAPSYTSFCIGAGVMGLGMGAMDVAMNAHGLAVEKAIGRPVISSFHAAFSVGATAGAFGASWVMLHWGAAFQAEAFFVLYTMLLIAACQFLLSPSTDKGLSESHFGWPTKATLGLGALCFLALMVEGAVADWAGIFNKDKFAVDASLAALGFAFYQGGMSAARFAGDWLRQKFGAVNLVVASAVIAAAGMGLALLAIDFQWAMIGYVAGGLGIGNLAPVLFAGGGRLEPDAPGRGIAAVLSMGYAGFLAGPPLIGFVAQVSSLQLALGLTVLAALIIALLARGVAPADRY